MTDPIYKRVIVKLSGEALNGDKPFGIDQVTVERIAADQDFAMAFERYRSAPKDLRAIFAYLQTLKPVSNSVPPPIPPVPAPSAAK